MSILWILRLGFIATEFIFVIIYSVILKDRQKYSNILENFVLNLILVVLYNIITYIPVLLPSDPNLIPNLFIQNSLLIRTWFIISGIIIFCIAVWIWIPTFKLRRALGAQDTRGKLLTSGIYSFCRHPIYLGISLIAIGIVLVLNNLDGLLVLPLIITNNLLMGKVEETYDVGVRFKDEYPSYKDQTLIFGPVWLWILLIFSIVTPLFIELVI